MVRVLRLYDNQCRYNRSPMRSLLVGWHHRGENTTTQIASRWNIDVAMLRQWMEWFQVEILERVERVVHPEHSISSEDLLDDAHITLKSTQPTAVIRKISHTYIRIGSWDATAQAMDTTVDALRDWVRQHLGSMGSFGLNSKQLKTLLYPAS